MWFAALVQILRGIFRCLESGSAGRHRTYVAIAGPLKTMVAKGAQTGTQIA